MSLFASLRNAVRWAGFDLGRPDGATAQAVVMIDPGTGQAVSPTNVTLTGPITVSNEVEIKNEAGNPVPVSGPLTDVQLRAASVATEPLGVPKVARQLAVTNASASVALTATCRRVSIKARGTDMRYVVGVGAQTADASTSHFIESGERLDLAVPAGATIAAIRESASSTNGSLAITELG